MKAAVITRYGAPDVVRILDAPKPTPAAGEVLVRVHAATVNRTDCGQLRAHPIFMRFFTGLELLEPGVVQTTQWRPAGPASMTPVPMWAGAGRKP